MKTTFNGEDLIYPLLEDIAINTIVSHLNNLKIIEDNSNMFAASAPLTHLITVFTFAPPIFSHEVVSRDGSVINLIHWIISKDKSYSLKMDDDGNTGFASDHKELAVLLDNICWDFLSRVEMSLIDNYMDNLSIPEELSGLRNAEYIEKAHFIIVNAIRTSNMFLDVLYSPSPKKKKGFDKIEARSA